MKRRTKPVIAIAVTVVLLAAAAVLGGVFMLQPKNINDRRENRRVLPETWALIDGLGRTAPMKGDVKKEDKEKFVGLFYWTWHTEQSEGKTVRNVTELLAKDPSAIRDFNSPLWEGLPSGYPHFWNRPIYGYYQDTDSYVLRKQAELIADAGVDVIFFDCTNGTALWESAYEKLFEVFSEARADGVNVPQVAFMLPFWGDDNIRTDLLNLYEKVYSKDRYRDLWFFWDGKPMIMGSPDCLDQNDPLQRKIRAFFTFRANEPAYFAEDTPAKAHRWGWCSDYPQTKFGVSSKKVEQMCVSVAQNAADGQLIAMNADAHVQGRGFAKDGYSYSYDYAGKTVTCTSEMPEALKYGLNFQQQWDYAIAQDPQFIFVTGWNEWIAGRWSEWLGTPNAFPDQFNDEFSRDCEPSAGILKDYYYCQLAENIRRFKGISAETPTQDGAKIYEHYAGSTRKRDFPGWGDLHYRNDTMRNDFLRAEVRDNGETVFLKIFTKDPITPYTDKAWMRIFVSTDETGVLPNWEGFNYIINRENAAAKTVTVERFTDGWNFESTGTAKYQVNGNVMELEIPAAALNFEKNKIRFNFKLSDNMQTDGDIMDFYLNGDVAPGGRFTFVY